MEPNYLGHDIPKLGFGLMRLPKAADGYDMPQVKAMVDLFMSKGFTYFDTAYVYDNGASERCAKEALVDRYPRQSFQLATKLPASLQKTDITREEIEQMFYTSLERTGAGYFDYYLLHNMGRERTAFFEKYDIFSFVQELKAKGLVRHVGFSCHDSAENLDRILTDHPEMEFVQLQINYVDWDSDSIQGRACYEAAMKHGKPIIIMEPVKGGNLASPPAAVTGLMESVSPGMSPSSWAVRYAASLPGVITVLSGMSTLQQVEDNVSYMAAFKPLSDAEKTVLDKACEIFKAAPTVPCTRCDYCKDCPQGIAIRPILGCYNQYLTYGNLAASKNSYRWDVDENTRASDCVGCGACEAVCPQSLPIIETMKKIGQLFD